MDSSVRHLKAGLIGAAIQSSLTPAMHVAEGKAQGFHYEYELIDIADRVISPGSLLESLSDAQSRGLAGVNITHPCKQLVIPLLDSLTEEAQAIGAVNTVVLKGGKRLGHNTDAWGFAESFRRGLPTAPLDAAVQIGAGGAGVATAYAILSLGLKKLSVLDTDHKRADHLATTMAALFPKAVIEAVDDVASVMPTSSGLIHATPTGMERYPGLPLAPELLEPRHWLAEIVYFPLETELLIEARNRGCRVLNGGGMAVFQAVGAFRLFTEREPDVDRMLEHFRSLTS